MPLVTLHHPKNSLTPDQKAQLGEELTNVLLMIEGGQDTPGGRSIAWVMFNEIAEDSWYVGGRLDDKFVSPSGKFLAIVTVPEGSMNQERKSKVHAAVNDSLLRCVGKADIAGAGRSVWVQVNEIPEGHWGTSGKTAGVLGIAMVAGLTPQAPILDFTRAYLEAKTRGLDSNAYPKDTAGYPIVWR
jgi:phenylpyruvate tautomerase PptA (4-oxalocrotonate tautomerase family)